MKRKIILFILCALALAGGALACACADADGGSAAHVHEIERVDAKVPTCTEAGYEEYWHCTGCGKNFFDQQGNSEITDLADIAIQAVGHNWGNWRTVQEASCTQDGTEERECTVCHEIETRAITANEHNWGEWIYKDDVCHYRECSLCHETEEANHEYVDNVCLYCGHEDYYTNGLIYDDKGDYYEVIGLEDSVTDTEITVPAVYNGKPVRSIGASAFRGETITSITLREGITSIGTYAFYLCGSLTSVSLPESLISIGDRAFYFCDDLAEITLPDKLESIGYAAFSRCSALNQINIPSSVKAIGGNAFASCDKLTDIYITDMAAWCAIDFDGVSANPCAGGAKLCLDGKVVTEYVIPANAAYVDGNAFSGIKSITSIAVDSANEYYKSVDGNVYTKDGKTLVTYCAGKTQTSFVVPAGVTAIGDYAFCECNALTQITLPAGLESIGEGAFSECGIQSVSLPETVSVIGADAFYNCYELAEINFPQSLKSIGEFAFYNCEFTGCTLPEGLESIGEGAFMSCSKITQAFIPSSVASMGEGVFRNCSKIEAITVDEENAFFKSIDGNLYTKDGTVLKSYAVAKTTSSFVVPSTVTKIEQYAFCMAYNLKSVTLSENLTELGDYAFLLCNNLKSMVIPKTVKVIGDGALEADGYLEVIYYCGNADEWKEIEIETERDFASANIYYYSNTKPSGSGKYWHYSSDGVTPVKW